MESTAPQVYGAIAAVMHEMCQAGIGKSRKNAAQGFNFRGVDDVYNALAPILSKHKLCILPRVIGRDLVERTTKSGSAQFYTYLTMEFDIVAEDGSRHTVCTVGEAQDTGDKSTNKAMSAAYKYACFMAFCIPVEGTPDADADTPEESTPRRRESPEEKRARQNEHDPSWTSGVQAAFFMEMSKIAPGVNYDDLKALLASINRPKPSQMSADQRGALIKWLGTPEGAAALAKFTHSQAAK